MLCRIKRKIIWFLWLYTYKQGLEGKTGKIKVVVNTETRVVFFLMF